MFCLDPSYFLQTEEEQFKGFIPAPCFVSDQQPIEPWMVAHKQGDKLIDVMFNCVVRHVWSFEKTDSFDSKALVAAVCKGESVEERFEAASNLFTLMCFQTRGKSAFRQPRRDRVLLTLRDRTNAHICMCRHKHFCQEHDAFNANKLIWEFVDKAAFPWCWRLRSGAIVWSCTLGCSCFGNLFIRSAWSRCVCLYFCRCSRVHLCSAFSRFSLVCSNASSSCSTRHSANSLMPSSAVSVCSLLSLAFPA